MRTTTARMMILDDEEVEAADENRLSEWDQECAD